MNLPAPARECSDAELEAVYQYHARRATPPAEPMEFSPAWYAKARAAHAASEIDDDPLQVARGVLGWPLLAGASLFVGLIALAVVVW